jgi:hypothetical protein
MAGEPFFCRKSERVGGDPRAPADAASVEDPHFVRALKHARLITWQQKAVEMGASRSRHHPAHRSRINLDRIRANVIEAAQQCGGGVTDVAEPMPLIGSPMTPTACWYFAMNRWRWPTRWWRCAARSDVASLAVLIGLEGRLH